MLIERLPVAAVERSLHLHIGETVSVKPLQPIVWISVAPPQVVDLPMNAPRFPAVLDTGFNQTLLIQDRHLNNWGGVNPVDLQIFPGEPARHNDQTWPFLIADIWLHSITSDDPVAVPARPAFCLETQPGILVVSESQRKQRLPVLGMRALAWNRIKLGLMFDGPALGWLTLEST
jgi:hypothetical protein